MTDAECVALLQWALPRRQLRWAGYRHVRGQVCKRLRRRMAELGLSEVAAYRARLETVEAEWSVFERLAVVTISRFYRDRRVWDVMLEEVLPRVADAATAAGDSTLRCWSIGCASGEEPYTLSLCWRLALAARHPALSLRVLATDIDERVLARAERARYTAASLRDLPAHWRERAFERAGNELTLRAEFRAGVEFRRADVRTSLPDETFRLVLCRNAVFTYSSEDMQRETLARVASRLRPGAAWVIGQHEQLPSSAPLQPWHPELGIFRWSP